MEAAWLAVSERLYKPPPGENTAPRINSALNYLYILGVIFSPLSCKACEWFFTESWECLSLAVKEKQLWFVLGQVAGWRLRDVPRGAAVRLAVRCAVWMYAYNSGQEPLIPASGVSKGWWALWSTLELSGWRDSLRAYLHQEDSASFSLMQRFQPKILLWGEKRFNSTRQSSETIGLADLWDSDIVFHFCCLRESN